MPGPLLSHRAGYDLLAPDGGAVGAEKLEVARVEAGWLIQSQIRTAWPEDVVARLDWELDQAMVTRVLHVHSRERFSGDHELELTVTGNGLLAHRRAPDGPTQVELGWGPQAELDYISAAFPAVMLARSRLAPGDLRHVDAVQIGTNDLVPVVIPMRLLGLPLKTDPADKESTPLAPHQPVAALVECLVVDTGHAARISTAASGALLDYVGLLRLAWLEPTK